MARIPDEVAVPERGLVLRRWSEGHLEQLRASVSSSLPELHLWMPWAVEDPVGASQREFLRGARAGFDMETDMGFGLFEEASGELVGGFGLHDRRGPGVLEIGYWVRSDRTRRGYGTATALALTDAAFACFSEVHRVEIHCDVANHASAAIPRKLGYRLWGTDEREILAPGQTGHHLIWAVTRDEWTARSATRPAAASTAAAAAPTGVPAVGGAASAVPPQ